MSMPTNCEKAVWELLDWNCGLDAGRTAFIPESGLIVSSYKVVSESTQKEHQIKTIMSGATITQPNSDEETVLQVLARKEEDGIFKYQARFVSGELHWLPARDFVDVEGVVSDAWLTFAKEVDLETVLSSFTALQLKVDIACVSLMLLNKISDHVPVVGAEGIGRQTEACEANCALFFELFSRKTGNTRQD